MGAAGNMGAAMNHFSRSNESVAWCVLALLALWWACSAIVDEIRSTDAELGALVSPWSADADASAALGGRGASPPYKRGGGAR